MYAFYSPLTRSEHSSFTPAYWETWWETIPSEDQVAKLAKSQEWRILKDAIDPGASVLEAGCGNGTWVRFLHARGFAAEGLDFCSNVIGRLRERFPGITWHEGDILHMPFPENTFDTILCWGVVEHFEAGPLPALIEISRILAPGGTAFISVPYLNEKRARSFIGKDNRETLDGAPVIFNQNYFTTVEFSHLLRSAGLAPSFIPIAQRIQVLFPTLQHVRLRLVVRVLNWIVGCILPRENSAHMLLAIAHKRRP